MRGINVGCGASPTPGFINFDNSLTVRIASQGALAGRLTRVISPARFKFVTTARESGIRWAVATALPLEDETVDVVYSSHMLEHLTPSDAKRFLAEARRVLIPGGTIRIVVPDLRRLVQRYQASGDANELVRSTLLSSDEPRTLAGLARNLLVGVRHHRWMYDARSLKALLADTSFQNPVELPAGQTTIIEKSELNLSERSEESIYVEANK